MSSSISDCPRRAHASGRCSLGFWLQRVAASACISYIVVVPRAIAIPQTSSSKPPSRAAPSNPTAIERRLIEAANGNPDSFEAQHALAEFYLQHGKLDKALPHLQRAHTIDPGHYANAYDLAVALIQTGDLDRAREHITRMLSANDTGELHNLLGDLEERAGNRMAAADEYQRAAHMDPSEQNLFDWGDDLIQLRAFEPATDVFTAAIARHPGSARLRIGLGIAQYSRGQYVDAVRSFSEAADLSPADPRPYQFLGEMYGVVPELAEDITRRLERFVKLRPHNAVAQLYYALSLWKGKTAALPPSDLRRVEALLRRAVALDPRLTKAFVELGILLSDQRRYHEAILELKRATELGPDDPQAHYRLGQAYQRTGQDVLAAKEFEAFERLKTPGS
jgi:tetratricopeptide (TPR) repeat protein